MVNVNGTWYSITNRCCAYVRDFIVFISWKWHEIWLLAIATRETQNYSSCCYFCGTKCFSHDFCDVTDCCCKRFLFNAQLFILTATNSDIPVDTNAQHKIIKQSSWSVLSSNKLRWYIQQLLRHDATIDTSPSRLPWHTAYITPNHTITLHTNIICLSWLLSTVLYVLCEYCQNCSLVLVVCVAFYNCTIIWTAHEFGLPDLA